MPEIVCGIGELGNDVSCRKKKGVRAAYWTQASNIDYDAMLADPALFDPVNSQILGYQMVGGEVWHKLNFDRKTSNYFAEYTSDNGYYEVAFNIILEGMPVATRNAIAQAVRCCDISFHLYLSNGEQVHLGRDWNGETLENPIEDFEISRHRVDSGTFGGDDSRNELDFAGQTEDEPIRAMVAIADLPL